MYTLVHIYIQIHIHKHMHIHTYTHSYSRPVWICMYEWSKVPALLLLVACNNRTCKSVNLVWKMRSVFESLQIYTIFQISYNQTLTQIKELCLEQTLAMGTRGIFGGKYSFENSSCSLLLSKFLDVKNRLYIWLL